MTGKIGVCQECGATVWIKPGVCPNCNATIRTGDQAPMSGPSREYALIALTRAMGEAESRQPGRRRLVRRPPHLVRAADTLNRLEHDGWRLVHDDYAADPVLGRLSQVEETLRRELKYANEETFNRVYPRLKRLEEVAGLEDSTRPTRLDGLEANIDDLDRRLRVLEEAEKANSLNRVFHCSTMGVLHDGTWDACQVCGTGQSDGRCRYYPRTAAHPGIANFW